MCTMVNIMVHALLKNTIFYFEKRRKNGFPEAQIMNSKLQNFSLK
jgi:hypothetical protein